ncbi:AMP-binding protein [Neisseria sp. CCUG12390]|uniref:AMP-binding protein n=1 Tax=Neisseria sp. CCUG12390 TaxID=3392035 RepID=UPI003A1001A7
MYALTRILSSNLPQNDLIALNPAWTRAEFNRAVFALSGRLKNENVRTAALWFEDAAQFACALLAVWHNGSTALLLPNLAEDNLAWAATADAVLTDSADPRLFSDGLNTRRTDFLNNRPSENETVVPEHTDIAPTAQVQLKTSGSSGEAQIIIKTAAQMESEALSLAKSIPFGKHGATVIGSVLPQHMYGFTFRFALSLTMGWTMVRTQAVYPEDLLAFTMPSENAVWIASPAVLNRLGEARNWAAVDGKLIGVVSAGGALPESTADLLAQKAVRPYEIYGSTETGVIASRRFNRLWQAFDNVTLTQDSDGLKVESPWAGGIWHSADVIEPQPDGFVLLGRKDRIIKFEDKRVSLTQIEHELLQHPWIADAHCGQHPQHRRIAVWVALNPQGITALREQGRAAVADALKKHLAATQDKIALPRYWRFADVLPRNPQAKISAADFQTAFTVPQTAPAWQSMPSENDTVQRYRGRVPLDLTYFSGHFAEFPLVPGVIELQWIRDLAAQFSWGSQDLIRVENLKYQQFIRPNDEIDVELAYDADKDKLTFKISCNEAACASGRLVFTESGCA